MFLKFTFPHACFFSLNFLMPNTSLTMCSSVTLLSLLQEEFKGMIEDAGFYCVRYYNLTGGVVALHSGFKLWDALLTPKTDWLRVSGFFHLYDKLSAEFSDINFITRSSRAHFCRCFCTVTENQVRWHIYWLFFLLIKLYWKLYFIPILV